MYHCLCPKYYCPSKPAHGHTFYFIETHPHALNCPRLSLHLLWVGTGMAYRAGPSMPFWVVCFLIQVCHVCLVIVSWLSKCNPVLLGQTNNNIALFIEVYSVPGTLLSASHVLTQLLAKPLNSLLCLAAQYPPEARSLPYTSNCHWDLCFRINNVIFQQWHHPPNCRPRGLDPCYCFLLMIPGITGGCLTWNHI